jgi:hypothetical protein
VSDTRVRSLRLHRKMCSTLGSWGSTTNSRSALSVLALVLYKTTKLTQTSSQRNALHNILSAFPCFSLLRVHRQMRYTLGSWGSSRSYVIGYGPSQPQRPHHRQTACAAQYNEPCALQNSGTCCAGESGKPPAESFFPVVLSVKCTAAPAVCSTGSS